MDKFSGIKYSVFFFLFTIGIFVPISEIVGTTFVPVSLDTQVKNADGVIHGKFSGKTFKRIRTGDVVTEASFEILAMSGISFRKVVNQNNFKVLYPGGTWNGMVQSISGTPRFKKYEEVVLFVAEGPYGMQLVNLGLSKYTLFKEDNEIFLQNSIFPRHPRLGKIPLSTLNNLLEDKFGHPLRTFNQDKYVYKGPTLKRLQQPNRYPAFDRSPASSENRAKTTKNSPIHIFWIVFVLTVLGGGFMLYGKYDD